MRIIKKEFPQQFNQIYKIQIENTLFYNSNYIGDKNMETIFYQSPFSKSQCICPKIQEKYDNP